MTHIYNVFSPEIESISLGSALERQRKCDLLLDMLPPPAVNGLKHVHASRHQQTFTTMLRQLSTALLQGQFNHHIGTEATEWICMIFKEGCEIFIHWSMLRCYRKLGISLTH